MPHSELLQTLRALLGPSHVLVDGDLSAYELDWRGRERGKALAVVRPGSTQEVAAVVKACVAAGVSMVPQGGNTGMVVGSTPDASGEQVVISLGRMNAVRKLDADNLTITVDAGCILQNLQTVCEAAGLLFPLSLASQGSCTIGGNLGTNAGGTQVVRFGNTRDLCLGLEVVTPQGEIWDGLTGLRKDNTGYDLRHLFIGSEGTLGIITAAVMTALVALPSLKAAVQLLGLAHSHLGAGLTGFEVMGQFALSLVHKHFPEQRVPFFQTVPYCVVLENSDTESEAHARTQLETLLEAAVEQGCAVDAVVAENIAQARAKEGLNIKHDISIAVSRIPEFVAQAETALARSHPGIRLVNYGHLGDGNLHFNVQAPVEADAQAFLRDEEGPINAVVYGLVDAFNGSISAEHGIGSLKREKLAKHKSPVALDMMRAIKGVLDPHNRMNPGRMLNPDASNSQSHGDSATP
jgi:FAD/FMN-containing dehydrogenase